jgi:hypothetical protein
MNQENELVSLNVAGSISFASGFPRTFTQNSYALIDDSRRFGANIHFKPAGHLLVCKTILQLLVWARRRQGPARAGGECGCKSHAAGEAASRSYGDR